MNTVTQLGAHRARIGIYKVTHQPDLGCRIVSVYEGRLVTLVLSAMGPLYYHWGVHLPPGYIETYEPFTPELAEEVVLIVRQLVERTEGIDTTGRDRLILTGPLGVTFEYDALLSNVRQVVRDTWVHHMPSYKELVIWFATATLPHRLNTFIRHRR